MTQCNGHNCDQNMFQFASSFISNPDETNWLFLYKLFFRTVNKQFVLLGLVVDDPIASNVDIPPRVYVSQNALLHPCPDIHQN
jgi:hypothetical protein